MVMTEVYTPWAFDEELLRVRRHLYSGDDELRRDAVACIEMWTLRGHCPHAILSSALLTDALLQLRSSTLPHLIARSVLASAITRFVSGFCDTPQQRRKDTRRAMADIAKSYGMPPSFVPLRHQITHQGLPSLVLLATAAQQAVDWLWAYYWAPLDRSLATPVTPLHAKSVADSLKSYLDHRKNEVQSRQIGEPSAAELCCTDLAPLAQRLDSISLSNALASHLARIMIPRKRLIGDSMSGAYTMFDGLLEMLATDIDGLLPALMQELVKRLTQADKAAGGAGQLDGAACWIGHLLADDQWSASKHARQIQPWRAAAVQECALTPTRGESHLRLLNQLLDSASPDFLEANAMFRPQLQHLSS